MNRLANEKSPYLLQHRDNPVHWLPWGTEAFEIARKENKPVFLSIGYSTCHWCHVMAHESFENPDIAALLNRDFVSIKVDREERPDVDRLYMGFVQATTGSGGWPMSVWLTPDGAPFLGGTYFPPEDRYGRAGFPTVLARIAEAWKTNREGLQAQGQHVMESLRESNQGESPTSLAGRAALDSGFHYFTQAFDEGEGGFGGAPKFPRPSVFAFLLRYDDQGRGRAHARDMAFFSLRKMAMGGMRDHLGGGFHRYSVDSQWHVPHFEKMLYDQAQLVCSHIEAHQITGDAFFAETARDTLAYMVRDLGHAGGGFYSAEDADSLDADGHSHEGAFYVWTRAEVLKALGGEASRLFCLHYGVEEAGNAPAEGDPQGEFAGKNILIARRDIKATASMAGLSEEEAARQLGQARIELRQLRDQRVRPHRDDKILTAWNGLAISAFARAGGCLNDEELTATAIKAARFVEDQLYDSATNRLYRTWRGERSHVPGFAEDHAFLIQGLLDLYEATFEICWLQWAERLQQALDERFWDGESGGYFGNEDGDPLVLLRLKEDYDGAEPSANSIAALNLLRLSRMFHRDAYEARALGHPQGVFAATGQFSTWRAADAMCACLLIAGPGAGGHRGQSGSPRFPASLRKNAKRIFPVPRPFGGRRQRGAGLSFQTFRGHCGNGSGERQKRTLYLRKLHLPGGANHLNRVMGASCSRIPSKRRRAGI